jgi:FKBP-type peptidyl-prolyl cis-trans isomerase
MLRPAVKAIKNIEIPNRNIVISCLIGSLSLTFNGMPCNAEFQTSPWSDKIQYEVVKSNPSGDKPQVGEMAVVRFKGAYKGTTFDDTFSTDQPYYYRAGVGLIVKGLDDSIMNMHV